MIYKTSEIVDKFEKHKYLGAFVGTLNPDGRTIKEHFTKKAFENMLSSTWFDNEHSFLDLCEPQNFNPLNEIGMYYIPVLINKELFFSFKIEILKDEEGEYENE